MSSQRNAPQMTLLWSPQTAMLPFNPVLTPGQATMPTTPYISTPLPYFTFSPVFPVTNGSFVQLQPQPHHQVQQISQVSQVKAKIPPAVQPADSEPTNIPNAPMLLPAPGSTQRGKLRKRRLAKNNTPAVSEQLSATIPSGGGGGGGGVVVVVPSTPIVQTPRSRDDPNNMMSVRNLLSEPSTPKTKFRRLESPREPAHSDNALLSPPLDSKVEPSSEESNSPQHIAETPVHLPSPEDSVHPSEDDQPHHERLIVKLPIAAKATLATVLEDVDDPLEVRGGFACPTCEKVFKFRKHCRRHMVNHTGKKPYTCARCSRTYARKDTCQRHYATCKKPIIRRI